MTEVIEDQYPLVRCDEHPDKPPRPGYSVCRHVLEGLKAAEHFAPSAEQLGHIACWLCLADETSANPERLARVAMALQLVCADCAEYHLGARLPAAEMVWPEVTVQ